MSRTHWKLAILLACVGVLLTSAGIGQQQRSTSIKRVSREAQSTQAASPKLLQGEQAYQLWLDEDVRWIISDEERKAFQQLKNDQERDQFIEAFWQRRDPTPDTYENEFKDEHYRRIVFANEQFGAFVPGWRTDRGRFYITYGPPDEIESHATGGTSRFAQSPITNLPYEAWHYNHIEGLGDNVIFPFHDICHCGDYRLIDDGRYYRRSEGNSPRVEAFIGITSGHARVRFKDLEEFIAHKVNIGLVPFSMRMDWVKATDFTTMVPITIQLRNADLTFVNKDGAERAVVHVLGRLTSSSGRVVDIFEDEVHVDSKQEALAAISSKSTLYQKTAWLRPGTYRVGVAIQDVNGNRIGTEYQEVQVPGWTEELGTSSLVLADKVRPSGDEHGGVAGSFLVGRKLVSPMVGVPGVPARFRRDQNIQVWMQVYGLAVDEKSNRPSATVGYEVKATTSQDPVIESGETTDQMKSYGGQITLHKQLAAAQFKPGVYTLRIRVKDQTTHREIKRSVKFSVE